MMGLSDGRKSFRICLAVLIQYRSVTDTQPASQPASQLRCRSYYAHRSGVEPKKMEKITDVQTQTQWFAFEVTVSTDQCWVEMITRLMHVTPAS